MKTPIANDVNAKPFMLVSREAHGAVDIELGGNQDRLTDCAPSICNFCSLLL